VYYDFLVVTLAVWSYVLVIWCHRTSAEPAGSRPADAAGSAGLRPADLAGSAGPRPAALRGLIRARGWGLLLMPVALIYGAMADTQGGHHVLILVVVVLAGIVMAFGPRLATTTVPYGLLVLGPIGLWLAKWFYDGNNTQVLYGLVQAGAGSWRTHLLLLQAAVFFLAGLRLLVRVQAPGAEHLRSLMARWRHSGRGGIASAQALLLLPVATLVLELLGPRDWFGAQWITGTGVAGADVAVAAACLVLVFRSRVWAATLAEAGLLVFGVYGLLIPVFGYAAPGFAYGFTELGTAHESFLVGGLQGTALLTLGLWLVPRVMVEHLAGPVDPELAARAARLTQRVESLTQTRSDAVDTAVSELRRIERDLHDGAQARLMALGMSLQAAERLFVTSPSAALALVTEAKETSSRALADLRGLVRGIYPPVLADRGLADAIRALALDCPLHTVLDIDLPGEAEMPVASAVYFSVAEALANVTKHACARSVRIQLSYLAGMLRAEVTDDGAGGAEPARGAGLAGVERRLATFDGILAVSSPPGGPTIVIIEVPCALSSAKTSSC
jgi:signal transduction histidine kinase